MANGPGQWAVRETREESREARVCGRSVAGEHPDNPDGDSRNLHLTCENPVNAGHFVAAVARIQSPSAARHAIANRRRHLNSQQTIRLAVIDDDSGFVTVLAKRTEAAGWQQRQVAGAIPPRGAGGDEAERAAARPGGARRRRLGLPRAGLRDAARPRRGRLHRPLDRRPAGARPAPRGRRLDHQALPPRGGDRADRSGLPPPPPRPPRAPRPARSSPASSRSAPTSSRPSSAATAST